MLLEILYTNSAKKDIQKLDAVAKRAVSKKIEILLKNPLKNARKLHNSAIGEYRWRIGNYRVVFDLEKDRIIILKIAHRKDVYEDY